MGVAVVSGVGSAMVFCEAAEGVSWLVAVEARVSREELSRPSILDMAGNTSVAK